MKALSIFSLLCWIMLENSPSLFLKGVRSFWSSLIKPWFSSSCSSFFSFFLNINFSYISELPKFSLEFLSSLSDSEIFLWWSWFSKPEINLILSWNLHYQSLLIPSSSSSRGIIPGSYLLTKQKNQTLISHK